ncbi:DUF3237 domain-containing protein [Altericroceibacterium endophyticum]|uniref:UPF0311 protein GRI91_11775 n=1 Tax=Altericroceibacterium endophyticum TaxID=1808508 RepID=A0A6I4T700_9SPHN|nr:DUF3237 domain-containing protein [Altericroceibacterium endophyticum]MXO66438.1 DUF3237 family protein [Altericroceibacterium endophyticum]
MKLEFALEIRVSLGARMHMHIAEDYTRGAVLIEGGSFSGIDGLSGIIVPKSGGDFPLVRADGGGRFESQYLLQTDDGTTILKRSAGVRHAPPEVVRKLLAGEEVDAHSYYMRMTPRFEAPEGPYDWLNRTIFVGVGRRNPQGSIFRYWKVI